jgi:UDPglucose 6-dehydrogenase/GDP-mannose 6-dehydrogenase
MRVAIVGLGYVGLVTGVCLAEKGHQVTGVDVDEERVSTVAAGRAPIFEEGLDELLRRNVGDRFDATSDLAGAVGAADVIMIAVGTPFDGAHIDLGAVRTAATSVGEAIRGREDYPVAVVKSTVVPGTTRDVVTPILEKAALGTSGVTFGVATNPEFLTEGQAVRDFMHPDRIVLGAGDERTAAVLEKLYEGFTDVPRVRTTVTAAEMIKYASNALLATMISFSNEFADLCSAVGDVDVVDVMGGLHTSAYLTVDGRRAPITSFLEAGCGFGGSCLPKDVRALVAHGAAQGVSMPVLEAVLEVNAGRPDEVIAILRRHMASLDDARITVLGLAFKPDTDDVRESPALPIIERLLGAGAVVRAHDPVVRSLPEPLADRVELVPELETALEGADAIVLVTRWHDYEALPAALARLDPQPVLVDGRRVVDPDSVDRYDGIGRSATDVSARPHGPSRVP